jgi:uncharacterized protein
VPADRHSVVGNNKLKSDYAMTTSHFIVVDSSLSRAQKERIVGEIGKVKGVNSVLAMESFIGPLIPEDFVPEAIRGALLQNGHELLVANSIYKASTVDENLQIDQIREILTKEDPNAYMTGEGVLTKDLIKIAASDFKRVDYISIGAIFLIIMLIFTSLSVPVVMVGSIELSIFINMAIPYFTGEVIPFIASIVIGCIQLGVTIDYAILLATRYREELRRGHDKIHSMQTAVHTSARSIVTSALTLFAATFGVGIISKMALLSTLCMMIARGAVISMVIILFVMPAIFVWGEKIISKTSLNWKRASRARAPKGAKE